METIELYDNDILEAASLGHSMSEFNAEAGDYIKVEIYRNNNFLDAVYSNRLLFKNLAIVFIPFFVEKSSATEL